MEEIERKFLVKKVPELSQAMVQEIHQGYLRDQPEIRIRKKEDQYFLTQKGEGLLKRTEVETPISSLTYEILTQLVTGNLIEKDRYHIPLDERIIAELDIYHGQYEGLMVVETEFSSEEEASCFVPPEWFGVEITYDKRYKNKNLARCSIAEAKALIPSGKTSQTYQKMKKI